MWTATEWIALTSVVVAGLAVVGNVVRDKWRFTHENEMQRERFMHERAARNREQCFGKIAEIEDALSISLPTSAGKDVYVLTGFRRTEELFVEKLFKDGAIDWARKDPESFHTLASSAELMLDGLRSRIDSAVPAARWVERTGWTPEIREKAIELREALFDLEKAMFATMQSFKVAQDQAIRSLEEGEDAEEEEKEPVVLFTWDNEMTFDLSENWRQFVKTRRLAYEKVRELASVIRES